MKTDNLEYVHRNRNLTFVKPGMRIEVNGKRGTIQGGNEMGNLEVLFEGEIETTNCHPHWMTEYFDEDGNRIWRGTVTKELVENVKDLTLLMEYKVASAGDTADGILMAYLTHLEEDAPQYYKSLLTQARKWEQNGKPPLDDLPKQAMQKRSQYIITKKEAEYD